MPLPIILDLFPPPKGAEAASASRGAGGDGVGMGDAAACPSQMSQAPELASHPGQGCIQPTLSRRGDPPWGLQVKASFSWKVVKRGGQATHTNPSVGFFVFYFI